MGGHAGSLSISFVLPLSILGEWLGRTFPGELEGGVVPHLPMWVFIQEHLSIHVSLHFPNGQAIPAHQLLGSKAFVPLVSIPQL